MSDSNSDTTVSDSEIQYDDLSEDGDIIDFDIIEGDFVIVKVEGKSIAVNVGARIDSKDDIEYEGVLLKKAPTKDPTDRPYFIIKEEDKDSFMKEDIVVKLSNPEFHDGSGPERCQIHLMPICQSGTLADKTF